MTVPTVTPSNVQLIAVGDQEMARAARELAAEDLRKSLEQADSAIRDAAREVTDLPNDDRKPSDERR